MAFIVLQFQVASFEKRYLKGSEVAFRS